MVHKVMLKGCEGVILYDDDGKPFLLTKREYGKADRRFRRKYASSAMLRDISKMVKK